MISLNTSGTHKLFLTFDIEYFNPSGKYYGSEKFKFLCTIIPVKTESTFTYSVYMDDVVTEIKRLQSENKSPGLIQWNNEFYTLVNHENGYPVLIVPKK
jgi:hypothetical protein